MLEIAWRDPLDAFFPLADLPWSLLFHSSGDQIFSRWSILCAYPDETYLANGADALDKLPINNKPDAKLNHLPFVGGFAGLLSYEFGARLQNIVGSDPQPWPDLAFGHFPTCALFDHCNKQLWIAAPDLVQAKLFAKKLGERGDGRALPANLSGFHSCQSNSDIAKKIKKTINYIHAGDIFQANISREFRAVYPAKQSPYALFRQLVAVSNAPFSASFRLDADRAVLSNSPERFLKLAANGQVQTHPIKGTRPRGKTLKLDRQLANELQDSSKDRAENLMIVDLMRNDLSRVCEPGSVTVPELFALQSFANVHHLVSTIGGKLVKDAGPIDVLRATFPPGSITGAPKIRAMQIIHQLEQAVRGPYCGALGYISNHGTMDFNVLIRTLRMERRKAADWHVVFRAGGGIVADSDPLAEASEMNDKAKVFMQLAGAFQNEQI